jgi:PKHD-type hydroxylase
MKADGKLPEKYTTDPLMIGKVRKLSLTLNLNSPGDYEGGNLKFDYGFHSDGEQFHECEEIRPQGSVIIFPSFLDHCVTPVTAGTRYSLVLWSLGQPFK